MPAVMWRRGIRAQLRVENLAPNSLARLFGLVGAIRIAMTGFMETVPNLMDVDSACTWLTWQSKKERKSLANVETQ